MNAGDHGNGQEESPRIGGILKEKRREKGLSLKDVEQATKIRTRYLEGLEREDFHVLPDAIYVHGFLKTYANFLGLDGERLSREFKDHRVPRRERSLGPDHVGFRTREFEQPLITPGGLGGAERRRFFGGTLLTVALAVLLLASVIGGLYLIGSRSAGGPDVASESGAEARKDTSAEAPESEPNPEASRSPATEQASSETPSAQEVPADTVRVTVRVTERPSWLSILADGTVAYEQVAQPGFSQTFEARETITVSSGNAGAVRVEQGGRDVGTLGNYGETTTRTFTREPRG
jgi:cytoskeleton protein RodZ